jgi:SPP1 gp7 family putative phage head morphogenesis protein
MNPTSREQRIRHPMPPSNAPRIRGTESEYAIALRRLSQHVAAIVNGIKPTTPEAAAIVGRALTKYAESITEWAHSVAGRMLTSVAKTDERQWMALTKEMSFALRQQIKAAPIGATMRQLLDDQVHLIQSIPLDAAQRVHKLVLQNMESGARASSIVDEIMRTGEVSKSRATTIARTETSRVATALTQARAQHIGSDGYIWRSCRDSRVRSSHKKMEGRFVRWDSPPTLDGLVGHAGTLPNCRCYPEPVTPED